MIISQGKLLVDSTPKELIRQAPGHNVVVLRLQEDPGPLAAEIQDAEWCDFVEASDRTLTVYPKNGDSRLSEILELAKGAGLDSVEQQEGRLDDLFRQTTQGVSR